MKSSKKIPLALFIIATALSASFASAKVETVLGKVAVNKNANLIGTLPTTNNPEILLSREQYLISYNKDRRTPNWVEWKLEASQIGKSGRSNDFTQDPDLEKYLAANSSLHAVEPTEYKGSCFDRGHQIPSGDRTDNATNNQATFLMSNMIPQTAYLNRVIWEHLESYTRDLVQNEGKKAYVIAGPIYDDDFGSIGPQSDILVPSKDFKIVIVLEAGQTLADVDENTEIISVIMPNTLKDGSKPVGKTSKDCDEQLAIASATPDPTDWEQYKTTVADIEQESGIQIPFLDNLKTK